MVVVIMTRSKTKNSPHQYQYIPFVVKALKQLLQDFSENEHSDTKRGDAESEDGVRLCFQIKNSMLIYVLQNSEWADSDEEGGELVQGLKKEEYAYLSEILGGKSGFDEDDESSGGLDDDDLKDDPVYTIDIKVCDVLLSRALLRSYQPLLRLIWETSFYNSLNNLNSALLLIS